MLYFADKQITRREAASKFGFDLVAIEKQPSFENSRKVIDHINGGRIKSGAGMGFLSIFYLTDPHTGLKGAFRYVKSVTPSETNPLLSSYEPHTVEFHGSVMALNGSDENLDMAVFFYLSPFNRFSPFRDKAITPMYEFIDIKARTKAKSETLNTMIDAINHANTIDINELNLLAKGMGVDSLDGKDEDQFRADMVEYASKNSDLYMKKVFTGVTLIEGKIYNLVDVGVIEMKVIGSVRRWMWKSGSMEGSTILDIINEAVNAREALKNHIFDNYNMYSAVIEGAQDSLTSEMRLQRLLESQKPKQEVVEETIGDGLPTHLQGNKVINILPKDNKEAHTYLSNLSGKNASWKTVSDLMKEVATGNLNASNLEQYARKLMNI